MAQAVVAKEDPEPENTEKESNETKEEKGDCDEYLLDMVFVLDCTGSMASYINSARDNIVKISQELSKLSQKQSNTDIAKDDNALQSIDEKTEDASKIDPKEDKSAVAPDAAVASAPAKGSETEAQIEGMADTTNDDNKDEKNKGESKDNQDEKEKEEKEEKGKELSNPEPKKKLSCKFAVVAYRDHPPQDSTFITEIRDFTGSSVMIEKYLSTLTATGGGDGPESLTTALYDTLHNLKYREDSQRIIIVITDAPCHGLEDASSGDGFPNGDPWPKWKLAPKTGNGNSGKGGISKYLGIKTRSQASGLDDGYTEETTKAKKEETAKNDDSKNDTKKDETTKGSDGSAKTENGDTPSKSEMPDILSICRDITDNVEASFYTVACEPCISTSYDYARDLMEAMAEMSNGKFVPLASANLLPKVILGSVKQQMLTDELTEEIDKEIEELKEEYKAKNKESELTEEVIGEFMEKKWENANFTYKEVGIGTLYRTERKRDNIEFLLNRQECKTLVDFAGKRIKLKRLTHNDFRHLKTSSSRSSTLSPCMAMEEAEASPSGMERFKSSLSGMFDGVSSLFSKSASRDTDRRRNRLLLSLSRDSLSASAPGKKTKAKKSDDMVLSTRFGDDDDDGNRSCSEDEQEVYEEVRTIDKKGVRKAVSRYMQTYY